MDPEKTEALLTELTDLIRRQTEHFERMAEVNERNLQMYERQTEELTAAAKTERRTRITFIVLFVLLSVAAIWVRLGPTGY